MQFKTHFNYTLIPDTFIEKYIPYMEADCIKVYLYCLLISKENKSVNVEEMSEKLFIQPSSIEKALTHLQSVGVLVCDDDSFILNDIKENKPTKSEPNDKLKELINLIDNKFFNGHMTNYLHSEIEKMNTLYGFQEDLIYYLFEYCNKKSSLDDTFILKIAKSWHKNNLKTKEDLENYSCQMEKSKGIKAKILKKLNIKRELTQYEEILVSKWINTYKYPFEIIEQALIKTTATTNPNFQYIGKIIDNWYQNGVRTVEDIMEYEKVYREKQIRPKSAQQRGNFEQRKHEESYYDSLYEN